MASDFSPEQYNRALAFAAAAHGAQLVPGSQLPYVVHLANVAMEIFGAALQPDPGAAPWDLNFALTCALLHDTLEDTATTEAALASAFGQSVASGVRALTKDARLPKDQQMADSLARIAAAPREVAMVKLADRITNLQPPPKHWQRPKCTAYREEARKILAVLGTASASLGDRLAARIARYGDYCD